MSERSTPSPTLTHRIEHLLFRVAETLLAGASMETCVTVGRLLGRSFHALSPRYRQLIRRNLRIATASTPPTREKLDALVLETFCRSGANFLGSLRTSSLPIDELEARLRSDGMELLGSLNQLKTGLVMTMPHMGNWEALTQLCPSYLDGATFGAIYRPLDNPLMDGLTLRQRTSRGARMFSRKDGFHAPAAMLKEPGALGVLADQRAGGRGVAMPFLGKLTTVSQLPELLAKRSRSRVCTLSTVSEENARWRAIMRELPPPITTRKVISGLEDRIRESLTDVFWFHDRWRIDRARPLSLFTKIDPEVAAEATVPLRLILTTPPEADETGIQAMLTRMIEKRPDLRIELLSSGSVQFCDPRVIEHRYDPTLPPEHADSVMRSVDDSHPAPLDGALLFGNEVGLAFAARRLGLRCIIGLGVRKKPWSASLDAPRSIADWIELAESMARVPQRHRL